MFIGRDRKSFIRRRFYGASNATRIEIEMRKSIPERVILQIDNWTGSTAFDSDAQGRRSIMKLNYKLDIGIETPCRPPWL